MSGIKHWGFVLITALSIYATGGCMDKKLAKKWSMYIPDQLILDSIAGTYVRDSTSLEMQEVLEIHKNGAYRWEQVVVSVVDIATISHYGQWSLDANRIVLRPITTIPEILKNKLEFRIYKLDGETVIVSNAQIKDIHESGPRPGDLYKQRDSATVSGTVF